ncbi:hypothetical protein HanLR1_Chr16g0607961 [Helianthus annuus]|nr:hypothetical protein HanLR1_Chr16g0607961 [Helianthus annuus]
MVWKRSFPLNIECTIELPLMLGLTRMDKPTCWCTCKIKLI